MPQRNPERCLCHGDSAKAAQDSAAVAVRAVAKDAILLVVLGLIQQLSQTLALWQPEQQRELGLIYAAP